MKYPCGIIKDLLPLYIDNVVNEESKIAVETHLTECESCKKYYNTMKSTDCFTEKNYDNTEDLKIADSLKKIKIKLNKKIRNIIICSVSTVVILLFAFNLLFNASIKNIPLNDICVDVTSYPMEEIASIDNTEHPSVVIRGSETDNSQEYKLEIPAMPNSNIFVSKNIIEENGIVSVITWSSPYFIKEIRYADKIDDNILYIKAFKTSVFDNKAEDYQRSTQIPEFRNIEKIVFVDDGQEKVLWSK